MPTPRYVIVSIVQTSQAAFGAQPKRITILSVQTARGDLIEVTLDGHNPTPEAVKAAVEAEVSRLDAIYRLGQ